MKIYESSNLQAIYNDFNTQALVITFNGRNNHQNKEIFFGKDFLGKNKISNLLIGCKDNSWYQYRDLTNLISIINDSFLSKHSKIILYGSSMGGYACLLLSQHLIKCDICIAISPQYEISSELDTYDNRWFNDLKEVNIIHKIRDINLKSKYYIIYDQFHDKDSYHINMLLKYNKNIDYQCIKLPFSGHVPFDVGAKTLSSLVLKIIKNGTLNQQDYINFKRDYNLLKVKSQTYMFNMVKYLFSKKKNKLCRDLINKILQVNEPVQEVYLYKSRIENRLENQQLALFYAYIYLTKTCTSNTRKIAKRHIESLLKKNKKSEVDILMNIIGYENDL